MNLDKEPVLITSSQNERVKEVVRLRERRHRDETATFLIEGYRELLRSAEKEAILQLYFCPEFFLGVNEEALISKLAAKGAQLFRCSQQVFSKMSYRDRPDGLLGIAKQRPLKLGDLDRILKDKKAPFLVVAEAIEKPGNLGTILRSSDAVGVDALIVCDRCTDVYNPNVVRASVGTLFTVPVVEASGAETLAWLRERGIAIVAATPSATSEFTKVDMRGPVAIAMGTEQLGLSELWMKQADIQVSIPMKGVADSLNVAMATTLMLYEVLRQRS